MGKCPPGRVGTILSHLRPLEFQQAILLAQRKPGQREVSRSVLLPYLEREAGIEPSAEIGEKRKLWELVLELRQRAIANGCPCTGMVLPADWKNKHGIWKLFTKGQLWSINDGTDTRVFDANTLGNLQNASQVAVYMSFSFTRARAKNLSCPRFSQSCIFLHANGKPPKDDISVPNVSPSSPPRDKDDDDFHDSDIYAAIWHSDEPADSDAGGDEDEGLDAPRLAEDSALKKVEAEPIELPPPSAEPPKTTVPKVPTPLKRLWFDDFSKHRLTLFRTPIIIFALLYQTFPRRILLLPTSTPF